VVNLLLQLIDRLEVSHLEDEEQLIYGNGGVVSYMSTYLVYPTDDVGSCARRTITTFCSCTVKCSFHSLVDPESTNEMSHKGSRAQCNSRRSDVSPSLPRENANAQTSSMDSMGKMSKMDATLTCFGKSGVIKTTEDEIPQKS
jgi:hypothetical protein